MLPRTTYNVIASAGTSSNVVARGLYHDRAISTLRRLRAEAVRRGYDGDVTYSMEVVA